MQHSPNIQGKRVLLRQPIEQDINDYLACPHNEELIRMYGGNRNQLRSKTWDSARRHIERIKSTNLNWCIEFEGSFIGETRLTLNDEDKRARFAIGIFNPKYWNQGIGTEVTELILNFAFMTLKLHRIDLRVLAYNYRAIACYKKCGFVQEGIEREGALVDGKFESDMMMSVLDREWFDRQK